MSSDARCKLTGCWRRSVSLCALALVCILSLGSSAAAGPVDVLQALEFPSLPEGVMQTAGFCKSRRHSGTPDVAYRVTKPAQLSAPTSHSTLGVSGSGFRGTLSDPLALPTDGTFPQDFSILMTLRPKRTTQAFLLSIYSGQQVQQLGVEIGRSPFFLYEDQHGQPPQSSTPIFSSVSLADNKWKKVTRPLARAHNAILDTSGILVFGTRILDQEVYE
ncbi:LOW QUALITY PROTEIN: collagen alpha-1(XI) chain-like, partial [Leucoraja erinacea]|uniref:LOW QUALITY PROTEIN: collagen alpha-1(XI) chain-like n=1 Tax=Leucoraja erinaceus TaxID=7782 RepID=UPI0024554114